IALLSQPIWSIFYGMKSIYGPNILAISVLTTITFNIYLIVMSTLQGINKFKLVYQTTIIGFALNALLDIPLMLFFDKLGIPAFYGAIIATAVGYAVSACYALLSLKKEYQINYHKTWQTVSKMIFPTMAMIVSVMLIKFFVPYEVMSKASCLLYILINASVGALCYLVFAHKLGLINKILGEHLINNILRKVTFGKYPKNNKAV
ncbi:MAG TPA: polysaccharide biosynthesis C-terminal domain-containing protein, partial [Bacilli bacterium]|nr:polysaccharide biosynthesis C-terminal domain-containing protein [Bacilli bacterium]